MDDPFSCADCGYVFPGDDVHFDMDEVDEDGDIRGTCPNCGSDQISSL